ncbi:hypothetical protein BH11PSE5_BH11PSE5_21550 [soil metagenome]
MTAKSAVQWLTRRWRLPAIVLATAFAIVAGLAGIGTGIERGIAEARYSLRHRAASGDLVIVEIDARSIAAIDRWPWPRQNYASAVDRLRAAGAAAIAFDVDFSASSNPADDRTFAAALARADGLVTLPTFSQSAGSGESAAVDSLPIRVLREHSLAATVSILPDADGAIRNAPLGEITGGFARPSLAAMLAGRDGTAGANFPIDYSIDPQSIPRLSFIDVRDGRFDPASVRGKRILIGATGVELGDRYGVPRFGVIPGVVIQALAAETLARGVPVGIGWPVPLAIAIALAAVVIQSRSSRTLMLGAIMAAGLIFGAGVGLSALGWEASLVPALLVIYVSATCGGLVQLMAWLEERRARDDATGMRNQNALAEALQGRSDFTVAAIRIADYDRLLASLGAESIADLICRLGDRIGMLEGGIEVYRIDDRVLAWAASVDVDTLATRHERLRAVMVTPIEVKGRRVDVSLASGFAQLQWGSERDAIANAAMAADLAVSSGAGWHLHAATDTEAANTDLSLAGDLEEAMANGDLYAVYQPKLDLKTGAIVSVEALVRWRHCELGMLAPDRFIPLLEKSDRIASLTLYVVKYAIADLKSWAALGYDLTVAVNISAVLLESASFIDALERLLLESDVDPRMLTFEVTESAAMHAPDAAAATLLRFKSLGIAISMDDYGTGQSTLTYLKNLPLDELKIDRSFVENAHQNRGDAVLVRSTIDLAHELGLKVVAEGVETDECLAFLRSAGCDLAQGYLISSPVAAQMIVELIAQNEGRAVA